eukprot:TRINITY_DN4638_c0_g1_i1.p1 TRINITY_DN4638_c0_g1~~TRINITY_DN4638_c0_g1_i1.p1  ORF type:complete len:110 (-),score=11.79 TRINITY_DN4638_c0_g1_i1:557-886(-)
MTKKKVDYPLFRHRILSHISERCRSPQKQSSNPLPIGLTQIVSIVGDCTPFSSRGTKYVQEFLNPLFDSSARSPLFSTSTVIIFGFTGFWSKIILVIKLSELKVKMIVQ